MALIEDRNSVIDFWRGFSALSVALLHSREILWIGWRQYMAQGFLAFDFPTIVALTLSPAMFGSMGVAFFFVLSGFCIHASHGQALAKNPGYRLNIRKFAWKRALRIYPPFCAALLLTAGLDAVSRHYSPGCYKLGDDSVLTFVMNFLTLQNIYAPAFGTNIALWSLSVEMHIYMVYPLLFLLRRRTGLLSTMVIVVLVNLISVAATIPSGLILFTNYLVVWWAGAIVAEKSEILAHKLWLLAGMALVTVGFAVLQLNPMLAFQLCGIGFAALLSRTMRIGALISFGWPVILLGKFSYSLYLIHIPLLVIMLSVVYNGVKPTLIFPAIYGVFTSILAAYVFYILVERGSQRLASLGRSTSLTPVQTVGA